MSASLRNTMSGNQEATHNSDLARRYRIMEGDRNSYAEESADTVRRQNLIIERLRKENAHLRTKVATETVDATAIRSKQLTQSTRTALAQKNSLETRIRDQKERLNQLEAQLASTEQEIATLRRQRAKTTLQRPTAASVEKRVSVLENRLEKALCDYNTIITENRRLREEITSLRQEHVAFDKIYKQLAASAAEKQEAIHTLMVQAKQEFARRETALAELAQQREAAARETASFQREWEELGKMLEREVQKHSLHVTLERQQRQDAAQAEMLEREAFQREHLSGTGHDGNSEDNFSRSLGGANNSNGFGNGNTVSGTDADNIQTYEAAFKEIMRVLKVDQVTNSSTSSAILEENSASAENNEEIKTAAAILATLPLTKKDIENTVEKFIHLEEINFSLFNYSSELRCEIERHEEGIVKLREELLEAKTRKANHELQVSSNIQQLQRQLEIVRETGRQSDVELQNLRNDLVSVCSIVDVLFKALGCSPIGGINVSSEELAKTLGGFNDKNDLPNDQIDKNKTNIATIGSGAVNTENILTYLSAIEGSIDSLLIRITHQIKTGILPAETLDAIMFKEIDENVAMTLTPAASALLNTKLKITGANQSADQNW